MVCALVAIAGLSTLAGSQCGGFDVGSQPLPIFTNTTDKTNNDAAFVGAEACRSCHATLAAGNDLSGHVHALKRIEGLPPEFPADATRAGVPMPPAGQAFTDIAYVLGGHHKAANFLDLDGFFLTTFETGVDTQFNLGEPENGSMPGFVPFHPDPPVPLPFDFECFRCHTTGPMMQNPAAPTFQQNRPGIPGGWAEAGVQCEACHGPGSNHVNNPQARNLFVDPTGDQTCNQCHSRDFDPDSREILAADGFILPYQAHTELRASGGHADLDCTFCHSPHHSTIFEKANGIRNRCSACHPEFNMALHADKVFVRGDYVEPLTCESCHMPFATRLATAAAADVVGAVGRMGDVRSHIFRINTQTADFNDFFTADRSAVARDAEGRAAVTVDFVCLRCHNGIGAFTISLETAAGIALNLHNEVP